MGNPLVSPFSPRFCTSSPEGTIYNIFDSMGSLIIRDMEM